MPTVRQRHRRTDGRTDGRTTYDSNTALVHRAVNMIQRIEADGTTPEFEKEKNKLLAFAVFVMQYCDTYYELSRLLRITCTIAHCL